MLSSGELESMVVPGAEDVSWYTRVLELSEEGVLCSGELESIVVPRVTALVIFAEDPCEWLLVSSVQVVELSELVSVGPALSVEPSLSVEWLEWAVMVELELSDDEMGWAVSVELSPRLSVDEVGRETVT